MNKIKMFYMIIIKNGNRWSISIIYYVILLILIYSFIIKMLSVQMPSSYLDNYNSPTIIIL